MDYVKITKKHRIGRNDEGGSFLPIIIIVAIAAIALIVLFSGCSDRRGSGPPETVEEETVVITNPEDAEYIQQKTEELVVLLRTLKAYGAQMDGVIDFPQVNGRCRIIHLKSDIKVPVGAPDYVPKEGEKVN